jgi:two-component system KDP operon response regulator KdpE
MLLDVLMTPLAGFDVLERLRAFSTLQVIIFTARSDIGAQALKEGANDFVAKPSGRNSLCKRSRTFSMPHKTES